MRKINRIFIHCTASPDSQDFGAADIDTWHRQRGWSGIGYHYVVRRNGVIEAGRPVEKEGAHVKWHNEKSIGVVWVGTDNPTPDQMNSLIDLTLELMSEHNLKKYNVLGHYEVTDKKTCPNIDMIAFRKLLGDI